MDGDAPNSDMATDVGSGMLASIMESTSHGDQPFVEFTVRIPALKQAVHFPDMPATIASAYQDLQSERASQMHPINVNLQPWDMAEIYLHRLGDAVGQIQAEKHARHTRSSNAAASANTNTDVPATPRRQTVVGHDDQRQSGQDMDNDHVHERIQMEAKQLLKATIASKRRKNKSGSGGSYSSSNITPGSSRFSFGRSSTSSPASAYSSPSFAAASTSHSNLHATTPATRPVGLHHDSYDNSGRIPGPISMPSSGSSARNHLYSGISPTPSKRTRKYSPTGPDDNDDDY